MNEEELLASGFGPVWVKREGGLVNPDELTWECLCEKCQEKYAKWKKDFLEEQARFK